MTKEKTTPKKRPTAHSVAKLAGVSQTTVSFVINNRRDVLIPQKTRDVVMAAAKQLGYMPNLAARSLANGKTNTMALWMAMLNSMVYYNWVDHFQNEIHSHKYNLIISEKGLKDNVSCKDNFIYEPEPDYSLAPEWPVDGLFVYGTWCYPTHIPVVVFGPYHIEGLDYAGISLYKAGVEAVEHLVTSGRKDIAYVHAKSTNLKPKPSLREAYFDVMKNAGLSPNHVVIPATQSRNEIYKSIKEYLGTNKYPEAFFCGNDNIAVSVLRVLRDLDIRVPEDVAIIGSDGLEETQYHEPRLSTIMIPYAEVVKTSWEFMERRLNDPTTPCQEIIFDAHFVPSESS